MGSILTIITICKDVDRLSYMEEIVGNGEQEVEELTPALTIGASYSRTDAVKTRLKTPLEHPHLIGVSNRLVKTFFRGDS